MEAFSRLLDLTQKARHLDILLARISTTDQTKAGESLAKNLRKARNTSLRAVQRVASSVKGILTNDVTIGKVNDSTLQKRFDKSTERLIAKIRKMLPTVTEDSIKRKQLHRLRQDSRKLRYLLELSANPENSEKLSILRIWQEILAAIHDNDACIELL